MTVVTLALPSDRFEKLRAFVEAWLHATSAGVRRVEVAPDGAIVAHDHSGAHEVGTVADWLPIARALGAFRGRTEGSRA